MRKQITINLGGYDFNIPESIESSDEKKISFRKTIIVKKTENPKVIEAINEAKAAPPESLPLKFKEIK
jgi:hypothetical protein